MAEIWYATDAEGKPHAIKRMHEHLCSSFLAKKRFFDGCKVLAAVQDHEYVIAYEGHGKISGVPYLAMEYVAGYNLKQASASGDSSLEEYIGNILIDTAEALEHVHDHGYMHLDFKPENVLVTANGNIRLVDFDLARLIPPKPKKFWKSPGTPAYMSPEQLLNAGVDQRADIWAYGVAAFELLTDKKPFPGEKPREVLEKQREMRGKSVSVRAINADIPANLEAIIQGCLQYDLVDRFPNMSVVAARMRQALYK